MRVTIDQERCCGAGLCVVAAPNVFEQRDEDGVVTLLRECPEESDEPLVLEAELICPSRAIVTT